MRISMGNLTRKNIFHRKRGMTDAPVTRLRFLKVRFSGNPTRKRGKIALDQSLVDASAYQKVRRHAKAQLQELRGGLPRNTALLTQH